MNFYNRLEALMRQDMGGRGLLTSLPASPLPAIAESLCKAANVILLTGFPVCPGDGTAVGETDGPPGTANLAAALQAMGCQVFVVTDRVSFPLMEAALAARVPKSVLVEIPEEEPEVFARQLIRQISPSHLITLERPGKAADGHYHNMRGEVIDHMVTDTDEFLRECLRLRITTISIGDGGNELGMGAYRSKVHAHVPDGRLICASLAAEYPLASGVSNWWGWGLGAILSARTGRWLLPTDQEETELLKAVVAAGGVDGCTREPSLSVDRLSLAVHLELLHQVRTLLLEELSQEDLPGETDKIKAFG